MLNKLSGDAGSDMRILRKHHAVARRLAVDILSGRRAPGDTLPGEIEFSEQLAVSRTAYREAIRILVAKGLVESRPKFGTRVRPRANWNLLDPEILRWMFEGEPTEAFIRQLFELRMIIEPAAAALAAERRTGRHLAAMGHALELMAAFGLGEARGRDADQLFHHTVLEAAQNEPLLVLSSSIASVITWTTSFKQRHRKLPRDPIPEHQRVFDAIADGDCGAARNAMVELVQLALEDTRQSL